MQAYNRHKDSQGSSSGDNICDVHGLQTMENEIVILEGSETGMGD